MGAGQQMVCSKAAENTTPSSSRPGVCGPEQRLGSLRWWGQQPRARAPWKGGGGGSSTPTLALPECRELEAHNLGTVYMCSRSPELSHEHLQEPAGPGGCRTAGGGGMSVGGDTGGSWPAARAWNPQSRVTSTGLCPTSTRCYKVPSSQGNECPSPP